MDNQEQHRVYMTKTNKTQ